jgi:hypothetical protein
MSPPGHPDAITSAPITVAAVDGQVTLDLSEHVDLITALARAITPRQWELIRQHPSLAAEFLPAASDALTLTLSIGSALDLMDDLQDAYEATYPSDPS